jgi:hypothetical protein
MHRGKSIAHCKQRITTSSSSNDDDNMSLGADQEKTPEAHASTHNATSSSAVFECRGDVPSQKDPFISKYEAQ